MLAVGAPLVKRPAAVPLFTWGGGAAREERPWASATATGAAAGACGRRAGRARSGVGNASASTSRLMPPPTWASRSPTVAANPISLSGLDKLLEFIRDLG